MIHADDTFLVFSDKSQTDIERAINHDLEENIWRPQIMQKLSSSDNEKVNCNLGCNLYL